MSKRACAFFILLLILTLILTSSMLIIQPWKKHIRDATIDDLMKCDGIGVNKATRIYLHNLYFTIYDIDELNDLDYIGDADIEELKRHFRN